MSTSANTLFHFTKFENLQSILRTGFYPQLSIEHVAFSKKIFAGGFPAVCFCDIKLNQIKEHVTNYQPFGIGMKKEWGIRKGINPVFYLEKNSLPKNLIEDMLNLQLELRNIESNELILPNEQKIIFENFLKVISFCKVNNTKKWERDIKNFGENIINFYNEKEWRYLHTSNKISDENIVHLPFSPVFIEEKELYLKQIDDLNEKAKEYPITFTSEDVKYLIVEKEENVKELVHLIKEIKGKNADEIELLISRIISYEYIHDDN